MERRFDTLARIVASWAGSWPASLAAFALVSAWLVGGFFFGFLEQTYQLIINTVTTIVTFLMVFLIQATQNRDTEAIHVKLDELIRSHAEAQDKLIGLEDRDEAEVRQEKTALRP
jgi:low affinity Fe/Cu permease